jgi:large conductance mechanosensitive channel
MLKGFRQFVMRGNVVDLAVAVVIGAAFGAVVTALVDGFVNPLIAAIFGEPDLSSVGTFTVNGAEFSLGLILDALLNFVLVAAAIYFFVVAPITAFNERRRRAAVEPDEAPAPSDEVLLLAEIRDLLRTGGDGSASA